MKIPALEKDKADMLARCPELITNKNITVVLVLKYIQKSKVPELSIRA